MARITVPLDASGIEGLDTKQPIKVLVASGGKPVASERVTLGADGKGEVSFDVEEGARGLRVIVGPYDASDEEMLGLQTTATAPTAFRSAATTRQAVCSRTGASSTSATHRRRPRSSSRSRTSRRMPRLVRSIPAATAFPATCCYQLQLRAYRRTIVSCGTTSHWNLSERGFQVRV